VTAGIALAIMAADPLTDDRFRELVRAVADRRAERRSGRPTAQGGRAAVSDEGGRQG
jgi:hypothetical protein